MNLDVIIPVFNEKNTIETVINKVLQFKDLSTKIIIVNDGSTDGTLEILNDCKKKYPDKIKIFNHEKNLGKGAAIRTAIKNLESEIVLIQDADLEYDWNYMANKILTLVTNILVNMNFSDMETGYKVFKKSVLQSINVEENSFTFEPEITIKLAKKKFIFYEVPISYYGRSYEEGKKIKSKDAFLALYCLFKYRFF